MKIKYLVRIIGIVLFFVMLILLKDMLQNKVIDSKKTTEEEKIENTYLETEKTVGFSGRWFQKEIAGKEYYVTLTAGAMIYFEVEGTEKIDIVFHEMPTETTPYFAYSIDGDSMIRSELTENQIILPDTGKHLIQIVIDGLDGNDDKWNKEIGVAFEKIETYGGSIREYNPNKKKILFVGDSITEGSMIYDFVPHSINNSAVESFPWKTSQLLDAEPVFCGYASTGITENGIFTTTLNMLNYYSATRNIKTDEIPECDLIVLFVGTNDGNANKEIFKKGYDEVVMKLHERYPNLQIVCMIPFKQKHADSIRGISEQYGWCHVVETEGWEITYGDGVHPDSNGTDIISEKLTEYILNNGLWRKSFN